MSVALRTRTRVSLACAAVAALGLLSTGCDKEDAKEGPAAGSTPSTAASAPVDAASTAPSKAPSSGATPARPTTKAPASTARPSTPAPTKSTSPSAPPFLKLTESHVLPSGAMVSVTDVDSPDSAEGKAPPAGSQRLYVVVRITNDGKQPLALDGQVRVSVKRHDNAKEMPQVDWFPAQDAAAGFFRGTLRPGATQEATRGFAFEDSGFAKGYEIRVTVDQPGRPAPYPVKFLFVPPVGPGANG